MARKKPPGLPPSRREPGEEKPLPEGVLRSLLADPKNRQAIQDAHIVMGLDKKGRETIFFGVESLKGIVRSDKGRPMLVLRLPVDFKSDDVEVLAAACLALKGSHCYGSPDGDRDEIMPGLN